MTVELSFYLFFDKGWSLVFAQSKSCSSLLRAMQVANVFWLQLDWKP